MDRHPADRIPVSRPKALPIGEAALGILQRAGIKGGLAIAAFSGIVALNYGRSRFVLAREAAGSAINGGGVQLPPDFSLTAAVAGPMSCCGNEEHYERTLKHLLAGIGADSRSLTP
ncbi:hypothetical protein PV761_11975 [Arthrobacter sp. CC3]|uniref:hypothetical protein n=1 Tax=Arthrobacter sp. CC3 TaxID=3029185 RepID=UPI003263FB37